jgi:hypothetical protein
MPVTVNIFTKALFSWEKHQGCVEALELTTDRLIGESKQTMN